MTWLARRSDDDAALAAELAAAIAEAVSARHVVIWARRNHRYHAVGMWPEQTEESVPVNQVDLADITAHRPDEKVCVIARGDIELGAVVVGRSQPLSRHDERLLDGFRGQATLVLEHLASSSTITNGGPSRHFDQLSPRELEVLDLMAQGLTNAAICDQLHLSIKTVEPVVSSIFTKVGLPPGRESNRRVLAVLAYVDNQRSGLTSPDPGGRSA